MSEFYRIKSMKEQVTNVINNVNNGYVLVCCNEDEEFCAIYKDYTDCWYVQYFYTEACTGEEDWFKLTNEGLIDTILYEEELTAEFIILSEDEWIEKGLVDHIIKPNSEKTGYTVKNIDEVPNNSLIVLHRELLNDYRFYIKVDNIYYSIENSNTAVSVEHSLSFLDIEYYVVKTVIPLDELKKYCRWDILQGFSREW